MSQVNGGNHLRRGFCGQGVFLWVRVKEGEGGSSENLGHESYLLIINTDRGNIKIETHLNAYVSAIFIIIISNAG